jgi:hypothetical protein
MALHLDALELGEAGIGDHFERLARRIGQEMQMERGQAEIRLWISMLKSLAEASGPLQGKPFSPQSGIGPQIRKGEKVPTAFLWIAGIDVANPQASATLFESSCLQNGAKPINPTLRRPTHYNRLSSIRLY